MRAVVAAVAVFASIAAIPAAADAQPRQIPQPVADYLDQQADEGFSGAVLVARDGEVMKRPFGAADRELGVANSTEMRFRIGSLTKQFTAAAMLLLEQDGKLSLDDPVCKYLAPCPSAWSAVRLQHLLGHSSGIPDFVRLPGMRERLASHIEIEEIVDILRARPLDFAPGTEARYGNSGFLLSAYIIQKLSGQSYAEFLDRRLYRPLGMTNSGYAYDATLMPLRARGYVKRDGRFENAPYIDMAIPMGAGSQYATVGDLYLWDRALRAPGLLTRTSLDKMFARGRGDFGLGWEVTEEQGRRVIQHNGDINGFGAFIARYPDDDALIVVLTNIEGTKVRSIKDEIARRLFASP